MYLPRPLIAHLYTHLLHSTHPSSPPILILTALTVDVLCATRILTQLLKRDFIPHKVQPVSGYADLQRAGEDEVKNLRRDGGGAGDGGVVVCLGCGGGVHVAEMLGLTEGEEGAMVESEQGHGVEVWVVDAHRGWNLENVFGSATFPAERESRRVGVQEGKLLESYRLRKGGVVVWDEGDIESDLLAEKEAYFALQGMPEITEEDLMAEGGDSDVEDGAAEIGDGDENDEAEPSGSQPRERKRKASSQDSDMDSDADSGDERPARRRRSNTGSPIPASPGREPTSGQPQPSSQPQSPGAIIPSSPPKQQAVTQRQLRRQLLKLRRKHEATLEAYYDRGSWTGEPVSSMMYSLASELGREDNEVLWLAVVGVESVGLSPFTGAADKGARGAGRRGLTKLEMVKAVLRDEVRRLNPVPETDLRRSDSGEYADIPTNARSPTDTSIRLSPEPRFLLIRHWSLIDSMLHSPYLATRLHVWNEQGRKRLNKLLAKMGISLQEAGKGYLHLDLEVKQTLRKRISKFAEHYNLEGLVPVEDGAGGYGGRNGWGFVRSWGWRGTLSAADVATVVSAILEVGPASETISGGAGWGQVLHLGRRDSTREPSHNARRAGASALPSPPHSSDSGLDDPNAPPSAHEIPDWTTRRFFAAYDALSPNASSPSAYLHANQQGLPALLSQIPTAQLLARAILRTGSALVAKYQIRHLRAFRLGVVKEGPDVNLFTHPGALVKLAGWVGEAVAVVEAEKGGRVGEAGKKEEGGKALVLGCLDEGRSVYVVVGLGGGGAGGSGGVRSKAEIREREEKRKRRVAARAAKKVERVRKRVERRQAKRERDAANGLLDSDDEGAGAEGDESDATESSASSSNSSSGSDSDVSDSESGKENDAGVQRRRGKGAQRNRFGQAFQEVVAETGARVRIDSFEHSVVEVRKEDLAGFLEALSLRSVVG